MKYTTAILNTANLYFSIKDYERATNWYNEVLSKDSTILLAKLGLARCAYEKGDYAACDEYYGEVYNTDRVLAKKYAYLGAFEETSGRSFSLADRLENTVWVTSAENSGSGAAAQSVTPQLAVQTTDVVVKEPVPEPSTEDLENQAPVVAVTPVTPEEETKKEELEEEPLEGGDGDDGDDDEEYHGITSELDFGVLSLDDLVALAEVQIESAAAATASAATTAAAATTSADAATEPVIPADDTVIPVLDTGIRTGQEIAESTENEPVVSEEPAALEPAPETELALADEEFDLVAEAAAFEAEPVVAQAEPVIAQAEPVAPAEEPAAPVLDMGSRTELEIAEAAEPAEAATVAEEETASLEVAQAIAVAEATADETAEEDTAAAEQEIELAEADIPANDNIADDTAIAEADTTLTEADTESEEPDTALAEADTTFDEADTELAADDTALAEADTPSEDLTAAPETSTTSLLTDVPLRAVPRFTTQPSEEWAPKEAYEVESIPGMKSFDEEMGNYQNEKAFLYKDEYAFAVNPGEELKKEDDETAKNAVLEVNPFSSFLSGKEAEKMEAITNFKLEDVVETMAEVISSTKDTPIPEPEVIPDASIASSEETAVAEQSSAVINEQTGAQAASTVLEAADNASVTKSTGKSNKSKLPYAAGAAGIAAAVAALLIVKRRKNK